MKRGEVWEVNFNPSLGSEIAKIRPAIIISKDDFGVLPLKIVVPITDWKERYREYSWMTKVSPTKSNGLIKVSSADGFQVKSISDKRFMRRIGKIQIDLLEEIAATIAISIDIKLF